VATGQEQLANKVYARFAVSDDARKALQQISQSYRSADQAIVRERVGALLSQIQEDQCGDVCLDAVLTLITIGEPAIPMLVELLKNDNAYAPASTALEVIGDAVIPELIRTATARTPEISTALEQTLRTRKSSPLPYLISLNAPYIGMTVDPIPGRPRIDFGPDMQGNFTELLRNTNSADAASRQQVVDAFLQLHAIAPAHAVRILLDASGKSVPSVLEDSATNARRLATLILSQHANLATDVLAAMLPMLTDPDPVVRFNAATTLTLAGEAALPFLLRTLGDPDYAPPGLQLLELTAIAIVGEIGNTAALPLLEKQLRSPANGNRQARLLAINQIRAKNGMPLLNGGKVSE
jgi:hypothetical protein